MSEQPTTEKKTFILDPGQGRLFKNDKKGNEKAPDFRGELISPEGEKLRISGWIQTPKGKGPESNYISIKAETDSYQKPSETADDMLGGSVPAADDSAASSSQPAKPQGSDEL